MKLIFLSFLLFCSNVLAQTYGVNFTRITAPEWQSYTAGSQPVAAEQAPKAFDNQNGSKWLGLRSQGAWVVTRLVTDGSFSPTRAVQRIQFVTANDDAGRDPTAYKIQGSINGTDWIDIKQESISLSSSRFTASPIYNLNNITAYSYYRVEFLAVKSGGDMFQIAEIRLLYDVDDPQGTLAGGGVYTPTSTLCCGGSSAAFSVNATHNSKIVNFVNRTPKDSKISVEQIGNDNTITVNQTGTENNFLQYISNGSFNTVTVNQSGTNATQANYAEIAVNGNSNSVNLTQQSTGGGKGAFVTVNDNNNLINVQQKDSGSHYLSLTVSGGNKTVDVLQQGSANHMANVSLSGNQTGLNLTQSGSTQQFYSITHTCSTAGGCGTITVQQGQ